MKNEVYHDFGFVLPKQLQEMVRQLDSAVQTHDLIIDCIQDEIRNLAHCLLNEEQGEQVIDYYCRRRWF